MSFESINPYNNESLKTFEELTSDETTAAIEGADKAYYSWKKTSFDKRKSILKSFATKLRDRKDDFAKLITLEMGKRFQESQGEIDFCADIVDFYADGAEEFLADKPMKPAKGSAYIHYEPLGVLLGVMPWNFPFYQVVRFASPNLMAGNVVMVKHASNVPQCAQAIADLFAECGLPTGCYTNLFVPVEFVNSIIDDERVMGVSLTGSEGAGSAVENKPENRSRNLSWSSAATTPLSYSKTRTWNRQSSRRFMGECKTPASRAWPVNASSSLNRSLRFSSTNSRRQ